MEKDYKKITADNIKMLRLQKNIKQKEICKILNISQPTYSKYENGDLEIPINTLVQLSNFYDKSIDIIAGRLIQA